MNNGDDDWDSEDSAGDAIYGRRRGPKLPKHKDALFNALLVRAKGNCIISHTTSHHFSQAVIRSYLKERKIFPSKEDQFMPEQVDTAVLADFDSFRRDPPLNHIRLDWTFENTKWNSIVITMLAEDLGCAIKEKKHERLRWSALKKLAEEADFDSALDMLKAKIDQALRNQKRKVQDHWKLGRNAIANAKHAKRPDRSPEEEKAKARRQSRQQGVGLCSSTSRPRC